MKNTIIINGKILDNYRRGKSKNDPSYYIMDDGSKITKEQLLNCEVKIRCKGDGRYYRIKSITSTHLKKKYFGFQWRGIHKNPFKGHAHKQSLKNKLSSERKGVWGVGEKNPNFGKSNYQRWLEKYGKDEADRREAIRAVKMSKVMSGSGNPFYGKAHTKNTQNAITEKGRRWRKNLSTDDSRAYAKKISDSQKELQRANPEEYSKKKAKGGKASMLSQMKWWKPNKIECVVQDELNKRKLPFKFGIILEHKQFDFGSKIHRILLEVQGDYWHGNPKLYGEGKQPLNYIQLEKIKHDKEKIEFCKRHKFKLYHIWENDIKSGDFSVLDQIKMDILRVASSNFDSGVKYNG
jgi:hypothetical protein